MSQANKQREEEQINTFISITGASRDVARQFLEDAVWNKELAASNFYSSEHSKSNYKPNSKFSFKPEKHQPLSGGIATLSSIKDDKSKDPRQQNYFTGGKASGIQVQGPPTGNNNPSDLVNSVFDSARRHGAQVVDPSEMQNTSNKPKSFQGAGYKLGDSSDAPVVPIRNEPEGGSEEQLVTITFWKQGFTVNDGPLRGYTDPSNQSFLSDINAGIIPRELEAQYRSTTLNVNLVDEKQKDYEKPPEKPVYFAGPGNRLGSNDSPIHSPASQTPLSGTAPSQPAAREEGSGDVRMQIRLGDGTALRARFSADQKVSDIRAFVENARPSGGRPYQLLILHPRTLLNDPNQSVSEFRNMVIHQKFD